MPARGVEYLQSDRKRRLDIFGASLLAAATMPATVLTGLGVAAENRTLNPLYVQSRRGLGLGMFKTYKFRTLPKSTENEPLTIRGTFDPRATRLGLLLRRYGLDELPQLFNVLRGDMSLVGHRPPTDIDLEQYHQADKFLFDDWVPYLDVAKPGLVSTSSIYRHGIRNMSAQVRIDSMRMDIEDYENASFENDFGLLMRGPLGVLSVNANVVPDAVME